MKSTWIKAIKNEQFVKWPGIFYYRCRKTSHAYDSNSKRPLRLKAKEYKIYAKREREIKTWHDTKSRREELRCVHCIHSSEYQRNSVYWFDRKFSSNINSGYKHVMVLYHYDSNGIIFRPMKNRSDIEAMRVYKYMYEYLKACNFKHKWRKCTKKPPQLWRHTSQTRT